MTIEEMAQRVGLWSAMTPAQRRSALLRLESERQLAKWVEKLRGNLDEPQKDPENIAPNETKNN